LSATDSRRSILSRIAFAGILWLYRRQNWRASVSGADTRVLPRKAVIIAVPHATNWDLVNYLGLTHDLGLRTRFIAKLSLFRWPIARFMRDMGGIPVDRSRKANLVDQMAEQFAARDDLLLTIAPEGSRSVSGSWKSGFYQIALAARVPILCGWIDYEGKCGGIGPAIMPTGDYAADMIEAQRFYESKGIAVPDFAAMRNADDSPI
tara:strand:+ start:207 stop:824 length:618 start_codon:yes stop_codon:yes gene_type:complete